MRVAACVLTVLAVIASLSTIATALHEDQKGKLDWSRSGVGQAKFVSFHPKSATLKSVYVASWSGVVASFGLSKGELRWRQVFGRNESIQCLEVTPHAVFVALSGSQVLNVFDPKTGVVKRSFPLTHAPVGCGQVDGKVHLVTAGPHVTVVTEDAIKTLEKLSFEPLRDATAASPVKSALVATDGTIGVYFEDGTLQEWGKINESPHLTRDVSDASVPSCSTLKHNLACPSQAHFALGSCKTLFTVEKDLKLKELSKDVVALSCDPTGLQIKVSPTGFVTLQDNHGGVYDTLLRERPGTRPKLLAFRDEAQRSEIVVTTSGGAIQYLKVKSTDSSLDVLSSWTVEEGLSEIDQAVFPHARGSVQEDHTSRIYKFGTNDRMILASRHGMLFSLLSNDGRDKPEWKAFAAADAAIHYDVVRGKCFQLLSLQVIDDVVSVRLRFRDADQTVVQLSYSVYTGELLSQAAAPSKKSQIFLPDGTTVAESGTVTQPFSQQRDYLVVNKTTGHIQGFVIPSNATTSTPSWTVSLGAPIVASDSGSNDLRKVLTTEHLRFIPNATTSANDVRRKYLTANTLVTCHFQPLNAEDEDEQDGTSSTLIVTAIDTISGQVIGRMRHDHVEGEVRVTVVENMVVYHFLSTVTMRHYLGVWELFEHQDVPVQDSQFTSPALVAMSFFEKRRTFSGIVARPPQIMTQVLAFPLGSVEGLGVTVSGLHVARKNIIITTTTGHVLMVPMSELRTGFQYPVTPNGPPPPRTLLVPSTNIISHQLTIHRGSRVFTAPTPLESTSHVLVAGLDLFYTRVSSGKPFDVIDDEFNYLALTIVCLALPLIAVVMRTVANRRRLRAEWA